jgi:anti-anti-sigma regulatory factor
LAFSLFGRKPEKKPEKIPVKKEVRQPAAPGAASPEPPPSEGGESLDFTNYVPSTPAASPPSVAPAPPSIAPVQARAAAPASAAPADAMNLDFGSLAAAVSPVAEAPQPPAAPARAPAVAPMPSLPGLAPAPKPAEKPAESKKKAKKPVDSILCIEVEEGGHEVPAAIEEAAVFFANGQANEALERIRKAIAGEQVGAWGLQLWLMLFDVLQVLGRKQEFEERALDFVVKFERSPPVWVEAAPAPKQQNSALRTGGSAAVSLNGVLSAASAPALEQLRKAAERQPKLRLDFAKLQGIEPAGCALLRDTLRTFRASKKDVWLTSEATLFKLLRDNAKAGEAGVDQAYWLLLLDLYQMLGLQNEFEEAAVDFAVTYEVSPPSWEAPPPRSPAEPAPGAAPAVASSDEAFPVAGEIAGQSDALFQEVATYAAAANPVVLDFAAARRIDFVNAGKLLNLLEKMRADGRQVVIRGASEMVIALFAVMGIHKVARIIPRK